MTRLRRAAAALVGLLAIVALATSGTDVSTARFVDAASASGSVATETLDPPTGLAASASGSIVTLGWVASPDGLRATGYDVLRGTASGGPYAKVGAVTPGTATTTTDAPGVAGTFYYVLQATAGTAWTSASSNEATAVLTGAVSTGMKDCVSQAADTGGDGNGYEVTPANGCASDDAYATDTNSGTSASTSCTDAGKDRHRFWGYAFGLPVSITSVTDISVRLDARVDATGGNVNAICAQLSWDGGATWSTTQSVPITSTTVATYTLGGTWGHTWTATQLSPANFRVRLIDVSNNQNRDFSLDYAGVAVTYTP